jgi:serine/threonine protein kinase
VLVLNQVIHGGKRKGLPEGEAQFYAAGIAEGLGYMHRRGYVYRDLKPENVLIGSDGYTVIVDFGFAKYVSDKVSWRESIWLLDFQTWKCSSSNVSPSRNI